MSWLQTVPLALAALLLLFLPGLVLARAIGARGMALWGSAGPLTVALVGSAAIVSQWLHLSWSIFFLGTATLLLTVLAIGVRFVIARRNGNATFSIGWQLKGKVSAIIGSVVALGLAASIISLRFFKIIGSPDHLSQTYDNVFHLNAIRFIAETGRGSSLTLGSLSTDGGASFYPGAWHDLVALLVQSTGASIPVAVSVTNVLIAAIVWPLSAMMLVSQLHGAKPAPMLMTGALAGAFGSFPYLMIDFGVLYPNLLSIAMLPFALGLLVSCLGLGNEKGTNLATSLLLLGAVAVGLALSHPSTLMALIIFALAPIFAWVYRTVRSLSQQQKTRWIFLPPLCALLYLVVGYFLWKAIRPTESASAWLPITLPARALGEAITSAPLGRPMSWIVLLLTLLGALYLVLRRKNLWPLGLFAISCTLYIVVASFAPSDLRMFLTGVWYNDSYRLAALLPVSAILLAVTGGVLIVEVVSKLAERRALLWIKIPAVSTAGVLLLTLATAYFSQAEAVRTAQAIAGQFYTVTPKSKLLSSDELALLNKLDDYVPAGSVVIGNPWTGASLVYALSNRTALVPAIGSTVSAPKAAVLNGLGSISTDPSICSAVKALNSYYVLDFGSVQINDGHTRYQGLEHLESNPGVKLIASQGAAKLYKITACG